MFEFIAGRCARESMKLKDECPKCGYQHFLEMRVADRLLLFDKARMLLESGFDEQETATALKYVVRSLSS